MGQPLPFLRKLVTGFTLTTSVIVYASSAASQVAQSYEDIIIDDLAVCSELKGVTKSTLLDFYVSSTRKSIFSVFTKPEPAPPPPSGLRLFIATDGQLGEELQDCLALHSTDQTDLAEMTRKTVAELAEPLPDFYNPHGIKLGPNIVSWKTQCNVDECVVTYVRWHYDAEDAKAVFSDFFKRLE